MEEREDRVMPQKIRSDRLTVNGRKKTALKRKGNRKKNKLEMLSDEKKKRRLFLNLYQLRVSTLICWETAVQLPVCIQSPRSAAGHRSHPGLKQDTHRAAV
jgi:hypothetical protein